VASAIRRPVEQDDPAPDGCRKRFQRGVQGSRLL
jgi:hypothetical protein